MNSASTVLRGAGDNDAGKVKAAEHVVAACGKASIKTRWRCIVLIGEAGLLDISRRPLFSLVRRTHLTPGATGCIMQFHD